MSITAEHTYSISKSKYVNHAMNYALKGEFYVLYLLIYIRRRKPESLLGLY